MLRLRGPETFSVGTEHLFYDGTTKTFVGDFSDFGWEKVPLDLWVVSAKTGRREFFAGVRPIYAGGGSDRETVAWEYRNARLGLTVRLWND